MTAGLAHALLADRYRLLEQIAVGGMGEVWRAHDVLLDRLVAVKTLRPEHVGDEDFRARFRAEARHAGGLAHPGIASVYDFGEDDDRAFLVMELVDGEPLSTLLRREGVLSVDRTLDLVAQTADALHAAHVGGVVHRDVKPGNLLVRPDGVLKVTDFGIASAVDSVPLTQTGLVVGTAYYLSPEQASGRSGSPASDVYGLGVVAYECLAGMRPFRGENPIAVALAHLREQPEPLPSHVPPLVAELVARAMAKQPGDRFPDAAAMAAAARELRSELADGEQAETVPADGGLAALPVHPPAGVTAATGRTGLPEPRHAPGSRSRSARSAVRLVLALLVVLSLGLGARTMLGTPADEQLDVPVGTDEADAVNVPRDRDADVDVQAPAYTGRPAVDVRSALVELRLVPRLAYDGSGTPVGTVSGVDPVGRLPVGSEVVLHVVPELAPVAPAPAAPDPVGPAPAPPVPAAPDSTSDSQSDVTSDVTSDVKSGPGRGSAGGPPDAPPGQSRGRGRS